MNVSGQSQGARFRQTGEYIQVLNNYLNIKSEDEFFKVFPEGKKFDKSFDPSLVPFFISMLALEKGSALHKYFAILTLFELLSKPEMSKKIQENYGFSFVDFHKITGKYDLFDISVIQKKEEAIREKNRQIEQKDIQIFQLQQALGRIYGSLGWKLIMRCRDVQDFLLPFRTRRRKIYDMFLRNSKIIFNQGFGIFFKKAKDQFYQRYLPKIFYKLWILKYEPDRGQLRVMQEESKKWVVRPKVSIVTPVFNPNQYDLTQCIQSVLDQIYDNWELCLADGGSNKPHVRKVLEKFSKADPRIKFVSLPENRGIVGNSNEGLKLANGEFVGFLDHDDMLAPFALYEVVKSLNSNPATDFFFSDEDKITPKGKYRYDPYFKPDWSPDMLLSYNYACHFVVVRKKIIDEIGGFREGFDGSQDYDLILRITKKTSNIKRIPKILYHWRAAQTSVASDPKAKPYAYLAAKKAIKEYSEWRGYNVEVLDGVSLGAYRVKYAIKAPGRVCIIIPTKDKVQLLKKCVSSVLEKTDYPDFEILIVDNQSQEPATFDYFGSLKGEERIKVLNYNHPFNFSGINNFAAAATDAEYLLFLNNDTEVINSDWLTSMLEFAQREDVGAVGARLYYSNHTIQHAGLIIGILGLAGHAHRDFPGTSSGYKGRIKIIQNVSAVTAACMMVRKKVFDEVGGFDEALINAFNDVDLCLKIREKGYLIVYTPFAELYHHESISRGPDTTRAGLARFDKEVKIVKTRWKHVLDSGDPYYNPNLTLEKENFEIKL
jgi:GT2 family glycosyltransferase